MFIPPNAVRLLAATAVVAQVCCSVACGVWGWVGVYNRGSEARVRSVSASRGAPMPYAREGGMDRLSPNQNQNAEGRNHAQRRRRYANCRLSRCRKSQSSELTPSPNQRVICAHKPWFGSPPSVVAMPRVVPHRFFCGVWRARVSKRRQACVAGGYNA